MGKLFGVLPSKGPNPKSRLFGTNGCACAPLGDRAKWDSLGICLGDSGFTAIRRFGRKQHGSSWFDVRAADATDIRRLTRLKPMRICNSSIRNGLGGFWNAMNGLRRSTKCRNVWPEGEGTKQEPVARLGRLTP